MVVKEVISSSFDVELMCKFESSESCKGFKVHRELTSSRNSSIDADFILAR